MKSEPIFSSKNIRFYAFLLFFFIISAFLYLFGFDFSTLIAQDNWVFDADNIFFPVDPLDTMVFPFQKLTQALIFTHLPPFLAFFKTFLLFSPVFFIYFAALRHSNTASMLAALFSIIFILNEPSSFRNTEQLLISSCLIACIAIFLNFKERPRTRIILLSLMIAALAHTKGICIAAAILFAISEAILRLRSGRRIYPAFLLIVPCLAAGIVWSVIATSQTDRSVVLFTETGDRLFPNLLAGGFGLVGTTEGNAKAAWDSYGTAKAFQMAAAMVLSNPMSWIRGIIGRISFLSGHFPFLLPVLLGWIASLFTLRRNAEMLVIPILAAYFFFLHILMPVEARYFVPAIFLMCLCTGLSAAAFAKYAIFRIKAAFAHTGKSSETDNQIEDNKFSYGFLYAFTVPYILVWIFSMALLATFPSRRASFDIDSAFARFPENKFLMRSPLRSTYPERWDYKGRLDIFAKTEDDNAKDSAKAHWLKYFASRTAEHTQEQDMDEIPRIYKNGNEIFWQDIFLAATKAYRRGDISKADRLAKAAALSCMLYSGYVRKYDDENQNYSATEKEYADKLAISGADYCAYSVSKLFFAIPPWEHSLKETMLENGFMTYMTEKGLKNIFAEKNSDSCTECCVPGAFLAAPAKCGLDGTRLAGDHYILDEYGKYAGIWCWGSVMPTNDREMATIERFCSQIHNQITDEDIALIRKYPYLKTLIAVNESSRSALAISQAYSKMGNMGKAAEWMRKSSF